MNLKFLISLFFLFYMMANMAHIMATPTTPPPPPPPLPPFQGSRSPISIISWNGEYFLIGTFDGDIVKYDGKTFSFLENFETQITDIAWNGKQWLIGGLNLLAIYDGKSFNRINEEEITSIDCNKKRCLIYSSRLLIYEIDRLIDFESNIKKFLETEDPQIKYVLNGDYAFVFTKSRILKYDGSSFLAQDLPPEFEGFDVRYFEWNGQYWLFGGVKSKEVILFRYDGTAFSKVAYPKDIFSISGGDVPKEYVIPPMIAWNGEYWLIDTAYSLVIYDGSNFEKIEYTTASPYTPYRIKQMKWNGKYWLLLYSLAGTDGSALAKFEDNKLEWLSTPPLGGRQIWPTQWPPISSINWNGSYWLIGISYHPMGEKVVLLKFDGNTFVDLTPQIEAALVSSTTLTQPSPSSAVSPLKSEKFPIIYKSLMLVLVVFLLISLALYLIWGKRKNAT